MSVCVSECVREREEREINEGVLFRDFSPGRFQVE